MNTQTEIKKGLLRIIGDEDTTDWALRYLESWRAVIMIDDVLPVRKLSPSEKKGYELCLIDMMEYTAWESLVATE